MPVELLTPGFDPTTLTAVAGPLGSAPEISAGDIKALISNAKPGASVAWFWNSETQPDVIATPALSNFVWINVVTKEIKIYDGLAWVLLGYADNSIDGKALMDGTVDLSKLKVPPGNANKIIQVNSTSDGFLYVTVIEALPNGQVPITKLVKGDDNTWLATKDGTIVWRAIDLQFLLAAIEAGKFPIDRLTPSTTNGYVLKTLGGVVVWAQEASGVPAVTIGDAGKWLTTDGVSWFWSFLPSLTSVPVALITPGTNGQVIMTVGGVSSWQSVDTLLGRARSAYVSPVDGLTVAHGLGAAPKECAAFLRCKVSYGSFVANKTTIPIQFVLPATGSNYFTGPVLPMSVGVDDVNWHFHMHNASYFSSEYRYNGEVIANSVNALSSRWDICFTAQL